ELWRHSVAASLAAEIIPEYASVALPIEVVTAGLLHDIGKLLVNRFAEPETRAALQRALEDTYEDRLAVEIEILGIHHGELGGLIVDAWKLPPTIATAIQYHHAPEECGEPIAYATALANIAAKIVGAGSDEGAVDVVAYAHAMEALGMNSDGFDAVVRSTYERFTEVCERYG
ncbi:MAG: HDOD domain-containing protein, partial [Acidimicrobiia bacterium]